MVEKPKVPPTLALLVSIIAVSTASILIRWTAAPPLTIATYRMLISVAILAPFFIKNNGFKKLQEQGWRQLLKLSAVGLVLAIHFSAWITSLSLTTVASSVIFVHIDPIFVAIVSHFFLGEKITRRTLIGIVLSFVGVSIIALGDKGVSGANLYGDLLALIGGIMLGLYILSGRVYRKSLDLTTYVTPVYTAAAMFLLALSIISGCELGGFTPETYGLFFLIALVPMIFGHTVYNWTLRYLSAPIVSLSLLGEPVGASLLAYLLLGETPGWFTVFGGVVTLAGILLSAYGAGEA